MSDNFPRAIRKSANSINYFSIEQWDLIELPQLSPTSLEKWWDRNTSNSLLSVYSILLPKQTTEFLCSLCSSLESIPHQKSKESQPNTTSQSVTRNSQIFLWVKDSKNQPKMPSSMPQRKVTGFYSKTYISCNHGSRESMVWKVCWRQPLPIVIPTSEFSSPQNHPRFPIWKSFLNQSSKVPSRFPMKLHNTSKPTCAELTPTSIKSSSTDATRNLTSSKPASSHYATSTR